MDEQVWRLPGPRSLIHDVLQELRRRRHVVIVLPDRLAHDSRLTDGLVRELHAELHTSAEARHLAAEQEVESLLHGIGRALVFDDYPPATLSDLLHHDDCAGIVGLLVAADHTDAQQQQLPELLRQLEVESRSATTDERLALVVIGSRSHLPHFAGGERSDVSVATVWWWNRVARWDVAAHASGLHRTERVGNRVLADVRIETIVEVARWDLDLAEHLAEHWDSDPATLGSCLTSVDDGSSFDYRVARPCAWPGEAFIADWDLLRVDAWHDTHSVSAHVFARTPERIAGLVWAAQARILLPWIEERRAILQGKVIAALGQRRFRENVRTLFANNPLDNFDVVEVGPLRTLVDARIGSSDPRLRSAARRLHESRNRLAHLDPLGHAELRELVNACVPLTD